VQSVAIHQKPEALHFGLDLPDTSHSKLHKKLRDSQGNEDTQAIETIPWRDVTRKDVINIYGLVTSFPPNLPVTTSAQFAFQMIEGVAKVVFKKA
jgi:hypothetical protein